jgi:hypothetical protein
VDLCIASRSVPVEEHSIAWRNLRQLTRGNNFLDAFSHALRNDTTSFMTVVYTPQPQILLILPLTFLILPISLLNNKQFLLARGRFLLKATSGFAVVDSTKFRVMSRTIALDLKSSTLSSNP